MRVEMRGMRPALLALLALLALGCGGETFSLGDGRGEVVSPEAGMPRERDAASDAAADAGDAAAQPTISFTEPTPIAVLADDPSASDDDPSLTQDLRELYFNSKRDGGKGREDVWYSTRGALDAPWAVPRPAEELNTEHRETGIALSADGLTVWFSSDRPGGAGGLDVYTATRSDRSARFGQARRVEELSSERDELVSALDVSARTLYFARRDDDEDDYDLFVARRESVADAWGAAEPIAALNSDREESDAYAVRGGSTILFTRSSNLVLASRESGGSYQVGRVLDELNSDDEERDAWASEDLTYLVFSSDRSGTFLLYEARLRTGTEQAP